MDFDDVLMDFGEFGTYQRMIVYLVLLPAVIPCGFHAYNQVFMSARPDHWCRVPALENRNLSLDFVRNLSVPKRQHGGLEKFEECTYYKRNYSLSWDEEPGEETTCDFGWVYNLSKYSSTIVTEWDLVCEDDFYPTLALVLFGVGGLIGNYIFGYIQDSYGRRLAFFLYLLIESVFGIASAFAPNFWTWAVLRFGVGFTVPAILESPYVLSVELVGPKQRTYCTILINIAYSMGLVILSGVIYLVRDWRQLTLATTLPFLLLFLYWWVLPESPRWLYAKGEFEECARILKSMAIVNKMDLPPNYVNELKQKYFQEHRPGEKESTRRYGVTDLFRYPNTRKKTILITLIWFTNTAVYVGLSYYAPALGKDEFLNFFMAGVVELPTYIVLWPAMEKFGRRWILCISMATGGLACLATCLTENKETVTLALYCLGKMGISSSFVVLPLMASELYPTVVRGIGISFSSVVGQIGPIVIPLINYLGEEWLVLPLLIMGTLLVVGGLASLVLPETLNQNLPQTLEEAELFGDKSWKCWSPRRNSNQNDHRRQAFEDRIELSFFSINAEGCFPANRKTERDSNAINLSLTKLSNHLKELSKGIVRTPQSPDSYTSVKINDLPPPSSLLRGTENPEFLIPRQSVFTPRQETMNQENPKTK